MGAVEGARLELAEAIARAFGEAPGAVAVALAGSATTGMADARSDLDLYVYANEPLPLSVRREIAARYAVGGEFGNDAWEPGDEWIETRSGQKVDVIFRTPAWIEEQLERVLVRHEASVGYSTAFWHNVLHAAPLFDPDGWYAALRQRADRPYPLELQRAIVAKNSPLLRDAQSSYLNQIRSAVQREDWISVQHRVAALLSSYFDVLFAVNALPHPGEKRLLAYALGPEVRSPAGMADGIDRLLRASATPDVIACVDRLIDDLDDLIETEPAIRDVIRPPSS